MVTVPDPSSSAPKDVWVGVENFRNKLALIPGAGRNGHVCALSQAQAKDRVRRRIKQNAQRTYPDERRL